MAFSVFLETIPRIIGEKYSNIFILSPREALAKLFDNHLYPLYKRLDQSLEKDNKLIKEIDIDCEVIFKEISSILKDIYILFFP